MNLITARRIAVALFFSGVPALGLAAPVPCSKVHQDAANSARATAQEALRIARAKLSANSADAEAALKKWFGNSTDQTRNHVNGKLGQARTWLGSVNFQCLYSNEGEWLSENQDGVFDAADQGFAFVLRSDNDTIFLSLKFYDAPDTGTDSKYGTLTHEVTHFPLGGGIGDDVQHYGRTASARLATTNPSSSLNHADAYQYLTEDLSGL